MQGILPCKQIADAKNNNTSQKFQTLHQTPPYLFMLTSMLVGYLFCFELKSFPKPWSLELDVLPARPTTKKAYTP
jgi:hypothetical protein